MASTSRPSSVHDSSLFSAKRAPASDCTRSFRVDMSHSSSCGTVSRVAIARRLPERDHATAPMVRAVCSMGVVSPVTVFMSNSRAGDGRV